jgi:hypothetical protein
MSITAYVRKAKWMHVVVPLVVLTLYSVSFAWFLSWLVPEYDTSVNAHFADGAWRYSLLAAGLYLIFFVLFGMFVKSRPILERHVSVQEDVEKRKDPSERKKGGRPALKNGVEKPDFILVLLPLTPVVQYILNNQDILSPSGSLCIFAVFLGFSLVPIIAIPTLLGTAGPAKTLMILGMAFTFTITNMASLSAGLHWYERGNLAIELALLSAVFLVGWILYSLIGRKLLYSFVAILFIANSVIQLASQDWGKTAPPSADSSHNRLMELVGSRRPVSTPSIYLLIYDSYVVNETMLGYGIDNSAQEEYLETLGFRIYPHAYSIGSSSISTMSRVLNASTEFYGSPRRGVSGDGIVQNLLKSFGYETCFMSWTDYFFQGIGSSYDCSYPVSPSSSEAYSDHELLIKSIFMGEFRSDVDFAKQPRGRFDEVASSILESASDKPRFIYMHYSQPNHAQLSGACRPTETASYQKRLTMANDRMKQHVETITQTDPSGIIVVAGDHGPFLTKNCTPDLSGYSASAISRLDLQDRFGAFLAIKWPSEDFSEYDQIAVLQDVFPAVCAYLLQDNGLLEARVEPTTVDDVGISGVAVKHGIICGGINDGEPLYVDQR